jgi:hypothetical protein
MDHAPIRYLPPLMGFQVLNLLLFKLTGRPYDAQLLEFLAVDELLVDIGDDLVDYEVMAPSRAMGPSTSLSGLMADTALSAS